MTSTALEATGDLVYRVRRGAAHSPLIVMLHGLSGDENVMWLFERALPRNAIVISPRGLYASDFGGYSWARSVVPHDLDQTDFTVALEVLQRFISETIRHYQADAQRVIVMGFSQGAALSYALSLTEPEAFCGAIALAGFMPETGRSASSYPAQCAGDAPGERTPASRTGYESGEAESKHVHPSASPRAPQDTLVFPRRGYLILHGLEDEDVPIERARHARSVLEKRGALIEYHEYAAGHKIPAQGMQDIAHWLKRVL
jgi:phospholipase/carboxylesterase